MPPISLPQNEKYRAEIAKYLLEDSGKDAIVQILGHPTAGKSDLLFQLSEELESKGLCAIYLSPPQEAPDSGMLAVTEIAGKLHYWNKSTIDIAEIQSPKRPWREKLGLIASAVHTNREKIVLLCDEPYQWAGTSTSDRHFSARTRNVVDMIFSGLDCRRVIAGEVKSYRVPEKIARLEATCAVAGWLDSDNEWGILSGAASLLRETLGQGLESYTALQIRLLIALTALTESSQLKSMIPYFSSRKAISEKLAEVVSASTNLKPLRQAWARIALIRQPFDDSMLGAAASGLQLSAMSKAIVEKCLLFPRGKSFVLHDTLKADVREHRNWLSLAETRAMHGVYAQQYKDTFSQAVSKESAPHVLRASLEAFFHASEGGDVLDLETFRPFFVEQLDYLGKTLSRGRKYQQAVKTFQAALEWNNGDDYAHHYLAYNLDIEGRDPEISEKHYVRAIEENPSVPWWHSRYICFLITLGRTSLAETAWFKAQDTFNFPNSRVDEDIYLGLHRWVLRILLHRGNLEFAERVVRTIPSQIVHENAEFKALLKLLEGLKETELHGAFVPRSRLVKSWWMRVPDRLPSEINGQMILRTVLAGRVETVGDESIIVRVAEVPITSAGPKKPEDYGSTEISFEDFRKWCPDQSIDPRRLEKGRFVEVGTYAKGNKSSVRLEVIPDEAESISALPNLFPDPTRYMKRQAPRGANGSRRTRIV